MPLLQMIPRPPQPRGPYEIPGYAEGAGSALANIVNGLRALFGDKEEAKRKKLQESVLTDPAFRQQVADIYQEGILGAKSQNALAAEQLTRSGQIFEDPGLIARIADAGDKGDLVQGPAISDPASIVLQNLGLDPENRENQQFFSNYLAAVSTTSPPSIDDRVEQELRGTDIVESEVEGRLEESRARAPVARATASVAEETGARAEANMLYGLPQSEAAVKALKARADFKGLQLDSQFFDAYAMQLESLRSRAQAGDRQAEALYNRMVLGHVNPTFLADIQHRERLTLEESIAQWNLAMRRAENATEQVKADMIHRMQVMDNIMQWAAVVDDPESSEELQTVGFTMLKGAADYYGQKWPGELPPSFELNKGRVDASVGVSYGAFEGLTRSQSQAMDFYLRALTDRFVGVTDDHGTPIHPPTKTQDASEFIKLFIEDDPVLAAFLEETDLTDKFRGAAQSAIRDATGRGTFTERAALNAGGFFDMIERFTTVHGPELLAGLMGDPLRSTFGVRDPVDRKDQEGRMTGESFRDFIERRRISKSTRAGN